jgi:hypothetical protein
MRRCKARPIIALAVAALCAYANVAAAASPALEEEKSATMLAYVKVDQRLDDGSVRFLADEVSWIHDARLPNDYGICNEVEHWAPYVAGENTACSLWMFIPEGESGFMQSVEMGLDAFIDELLSGWREGMLLAEITVSGVVVESIFEQYTP